MLVFLLGIGLWPLRFGSPNNAEWRGGTNGLRFPGAEARSAYDPGGMVFTPHPLVAAPAATCAAGSVSLELRLRPAGEPRSARARIVAVADPDGREAFFVGQWTRQLLVMRRVAKGPGPGAFCELDVPDALESNRVRLVTVAAGPQETCIYVDGQGAKRYPGASLLSISGTVAGKRLFAGNSPDGTCPWAGDLLGLAVYGRRLADSEVRAQCAWWSTGRDSPPPVVPVALYEFEAASGMWVTNTWGAANPLFRPVDLGVVKPRLAWSGHGSQDWTDVSLNLLGFVPLGFCAAVWLARSRLRPGAMAGVLAVLAGAALSLTIELAQVHLPMRDSSLSDLVLNILGTLAGVVGACLARPAGAQPASGP
ncbi:MAG: VanZ family protein [Verrucomicrobia bacterium]|nr:VanZ family protein [Verrucomicrobiota bacterium]